MEFDEMEFSGDEFDIDDDEYVNAFVEYLRDIPEAKYKMLIPGRVHQMYESYKILSRVLSGTAIKCDISQGTCDGAIEVECSEIAISDTAEFARAASFADNTEVYTMASGRVHMVLQFARIFATSNE